MKKYTGLIHSKPLKLFDVFPVIKNKMIVVILIIVESDSDLTGTKAIIKKAGVNGMTKIIYNSILVKSFNDIIFITPPNTTVFIVTAIIPIII